MKKGLKFVILANSIFRSLLVALGIIMATVTIHEYTHIRQATGVEALCLDLSNTSVQAYVTAKDFNTLGIGETLGKSEQVKKLVYYVYNNEEVHDTEYEARVVDTFTMIGLVIFVLLMEYISYKASKKLIVPPNEQ